MRIIYLHHAEREITDGHNIPSLRQLEDITENGIKEAELFALKYEKERIDVIITSPYLRCKHTAEIINKYHNVSIIEDERFNEKEKEEEWKPFLERNMEAIDVAVKNCDNDGVIMCVASGVNLTAFICYVYGITPSNDTCWSQAASLSPVVFTIDKEEGR